MGTNKIYSIFSIITLALSLVIIGCGSDDSSMSKEDKLKKLEARQITIKSEIASLKAELGIKEEVKALAVQTEIIGTKQFKRFVNLQGLVQSDRNVLLSPKTNGVITSVKVSEGQFVKKGTLLMTLDNAILNRQIEEVQHQLDFATTLFEKQERVWKKKVGSEIQYLQAKNNKENLENRLKTLKEQHDMSKLYAPFSGYIDMIASRVGEAAMAGMGAIRLVSHKNLKVQINYSEAYSSNFKKGDDVELSFPDLNLMDLKFKLSAVSQSIDKKNRTITAYVNIPSKYKDIKPNMICVARLNDFTQDSALLVPVNIIQRDKDKEFVYVNDNSNASKKIVKTGLSYKNEIIIKEGLSEGDEIITVGFQSVSDGEKITINK